MKNVSPKIILILFCVIFGVSMLFSVGGSLGSAIADRAPVRQTAVPAAETAMLAVSPSPSPTLPVLHISASSAENDLQLSVCDPSGAPVSGEVFTFRITGQDGTEQTAVSDQSGTCYLAPMDAGDYTVKTQTAAGQTLQITATVQAPPERVYIENLAEQVEITSAEEIEDEVKTESAAMAEITEPEQIETETLITPSPEPTAVPTPVPTTEPEEETAGAQSYTYTFRTDANHFLYYRDSEEISSVMLFDEDMETYGIVCTPVTDADGSPTGEWTLTDERVELIYSDGSVNPDYEIQAEEIPQPTPEPTPEPTPQPVATPAPEKKTGWQTENGAEVFYDSSGKKVTGFKAIDGKFYYFMPDGSRASAVGIDVSEFNETIDWNKVRSQGITFAIVRVGGRGWSTGKLYLDKNVQQNLSGARAAGLQVGVYFYSTAINTREAVEEASLVISTLNGFVPDLPIYFDTELSGDYPDGRSDRLNAVQQASIAVAFCETCANSGYSAGIYTNERYFDSCLDYDTVSTWPIWLASYTTNATLPGTGIPYDVWQFTSTGEVKGISGYTDMNIWF